MRSPADVERLIATRYKSSWRDWLSQSSPELISFALQPPASSVLSAQEDAVRVWLHAWRAWHDLHPATRLRTATVRTAAGPQVVYSHLEIPGPAALAGVDPVTSHHWRTATSRYPQLADLTIASDRLRPLLPRVIELDDYDFELLLRVVKWFRDNPASGHTARQVPVPGLHTKWLARHKAIVIPLLRTDIPNRSADLGPEPDHEHVDPELDITDLDLLGLRQLPNHVDIILADPADRRLVGGLRQLRAPVEEVARLPLNPHDVLIIENKESALPIEDRAGLVVIHSLGNFLDVLDTLPWLRPARVWYWGDLDRAGITLLSRARAKLPQLASLLMHTNTLHEFEALANADPTGRVDPPEPVLTQNERTALEELGTRQPPLRLEQERIPWAIAQDTISRALDGRSVLPSTSRPNPARDQ